MSENERLEDMSEQDLLMLRARNILMREDASAAELEFARKALNDSSGRGQKLLTRDHSVPEKARKSEWDGLSFDDVKEVYTNEGHGVGDLDHRGHLVGGGASSRSLDHRNQDEARAEESHSDREV